MSTPPKNIKNNDNCTRQAYVPASVKVIKVTAQRIICGTNGIDPFNKGGDDSSNWD